MQYHKSIKNNRTIYLTQANRNCFMSTLECKDFAELFSANGYTVTNDIKRASVIIVGTCTLLPLSDSLSFETIDQINKEKNPQAALIITGCMAKILKDKLEQKYDCLVTAPYEHNTLIKYFNLRPCSHCRHENKDIDASVFNRQIKKWKNQWLALCCLNKITRPIIPPLGNIFNNILDATREYSPKAYFLRISTGCTHNCAYCSIRRAVGFIKSRDLPEIIGEIQSAASKGYDHLLLASDDFTSYGIDKNISFVNMLEAVLKSNDRLTVTIRNFNPALDRQRANEFIKTIRPGRIICIELQLQSGSNKILKLMNRGYTKEEFLEIAHAIRQRDQRIALKTHVIVGFPGETEEDLQETIDVIKQIPFVRIDVIPYGEKQDTPSARLPGKLTKAEIADRCKKIRRLRYKYYWLL